MEVYRWNCKPRLTASQLRKLKKKMKKSFKKADKIRKKMEEMEKEEIRKADEFLKDSLSKI